jgi:hypothetical protein
MAKWMTDTTGLGVLAKRREARRQNRLANFVRPHVQSDEQIVAILSRLFERLSGADARGLVAVVVTNQRLIVIRLGAMTERPKKMLVTHPRDGLKVDWKPNARYTPAADLKAGCWGKLSVTSSLGSNELWAGSWWQNPADAIVKTLEDDSRHA